MIFDIFMYILGTFIALNGYRLSHKGETLYSQMTQMEMLTVISTSSGLRNSSSLPRTVTWP